MIIIGTKLEQRAKDNNPIKVGFIGAGVMAKAILNLIERNIPGMKVVAIYNRTPEKAFQIMVSWESVRNTGDLYVAFGLGFDYLFMPVYAFALAFGTLLTAGKHSGWLGLLGAVAGYGAFAAAAFDTVENYALFQILLGAYDSTYPAIAAVCASIKFGLLFFGLVVAILGGLMPGKK